MLILFILFFKMSKFLLNIPQLMTVLCQYSKRYLTSMTKIYLKRGSSMKISPTVLRRIGEGSILL